MSVITNDDVQGITVSTTNDRFSPEQIKLIQSMTKDQRIIIDEIAASGPDGRVMKIPASMVFTILSSLFVNYSPPFVGRTFLLEGG